MPLDPSILLGARGVSLPDPLETAKQGLSLQDLSTASAVRQYALKNAERSDQATQVLGKLLPQLQAGNWSDAAVSQAFQDPALREHPEAALNFLKVIDDRRKAELDAQKTRAGIAKDTTEARVKAFDQVSAAAFGEAKKPDAMSLSRVSSLAKFYGLNLPDFSGDPNNPAHITPYLQAIGNAAYAAKDQVANVETARKNAADEAETKRFHTGELGVQQGNLKVNQQRLAQEGKKIETDADGNMLIVDIGQKTPTAAPVLTAGGEPVVKACKNVPVEYTKQVAGITNLNSAISNYQEKLAKWSNADMLNPSARAEMGTAYNNMMLQAKEAFNLGVLNGNDYQILTTVVTDPMSIKGALTPNTSLDAQTTQLQKIMETNAGNLAQIYKQKPQKASAPPAAPAPTAAAAANAGGKFSAQTPTGVTVYFDSEAAMNAAKMKWAQIGASSNGR